MPVPFLVTAALVPEIFPETVIVRPEFTVHVFVVADRLKFPVIRDSEGESMGIAINIHKGGYNNTSSLGCQTIYPSQWDGFINLVYSEMNRYNQKTIPYLLVEQA